MKLKPMALGSAAVVALAAMVGASSGFAQTNPTSPYSNAPAQTQSAPAANTNATDTSTTPVKHIRHRVRHHMQTASESTPAEKSATADLNRQQLAQAESQMSGNTQAQATTSTAPSDQNAQTAANQSTQASAQTAMNDQSPATANAGQVQNPQTAQNSQTAMNDQSSPAASDQSKSSSATLNSDTSSAQTAAPSSSSSMNNTSASSTKTAAKVPLDSVTNPKRTLASAKVQNTNGQQIGEVKNVTVGSDGKPVSVNVSLQNTSGAPKTVQVDANQLSYDRDNNVLITPLSQDQINALPNPM
jgi:hypothetical protein